MGSLRVGHDWATALSLFTFMHWRRKWQPTPVFLPGESQGRGSLVGCRLWGCRVGHDWSDLAAVAAWEAWSRPTWPLPYPRWKRAAASVFFPQFCSDIIDTHSVYSVQHNDLRAFQWLSGKEPICQCTRPGFDPWVGKIPWRRKWQPTPVFLPEKSHGQRSLVGYIHGVAKSQTRLSD